MAFNFARLKQWLGYENIANTDLNSEFNNLLNKAGADTLSGANSTNNSAPTQASMQTTESPGSVGSETLSTTVQEDIRQLRYQLNAIIGGAQWYSAPPSTLTLLNTGISSLLAQPANRLISGRVDANHQPMFLVPSGAAATATLKATTTHLSTFINNTAITFSADIAVTGLQTAPSTNNTCLVNDAALSGAQATKTQGERSTQITIGTIGSGITALNGTYAAFKKGTEVFLAEVDTTNNRLRNCFRGFFFDSTDAWLARATLTNGDTITLLKLTWFFGVSTSGVQSVDITYNNPKIAYTAPSSPSIGDYWYDLSTSQWKKFSGVSFVAANATVLGISAQDTTNCIAARSFDFANFFNPLNTIELEYVDANTARNTKQNQQLSVYGGIFQFGYGQITYSMTNNKDTGVSDSASTTYYFYISDVGNQYISDIAPHQRKYDLLGDYHPAKPWRCVGEMANDGSSNFSSSTLSIAEYHQRVLPDSYVDGTTIIKNAQKQISLSPLTRSQLPTVGQQVSSSSAAFSTSSTTYVDITNLTVTITTTGRPVVLALQSDNSGNESEITCNFGATGTSGFTSLQFVRAASSIAQYRVNSVITNGIGGVPGSSFEFIDAVAAGTYTYKVQLKVSSASGSATCERAVLIAFEL